MTCRFVFANGRGELTGQAVCHSFAIPGPRHVCPEGYGRMMRGGANEASSWIIAERGGSQCVECGVAIGKGDQMLEDTETSRVWCEECGRSVEGENWADQDV
jgi:hypothetical protein